MDVLLDSSLDFWSEVRNNVVVKTPVPHLNGSRGAHLLFDMSVPPGPVGFCHAANPAVCGCL